MNDLYKYVGNVNINNYEQLKRLENKKLGITVKAMPAKIGGCFQPNIKLVTVIIDETVIGQSCNGSDFWENEEKVLGIVRNFNLQKK